MGYQLDETGKKCVGEYKNRMPTMNMFKIKQQGNKSLVAVDSNSLNVDRLLRIIGIIADGYCEDMTTICWVVVGCSSGT